MQTTDDGLKRCSPATRRLSGWANLLTMSMALVLASPLALSAATVVKVGATPPTAMASAHIIRYTPALRLNTLAARPDTDVVEFADGRRMHLGQLRRLSAWGKKIRSTPQRQFPAALKAKPAATGRRVSNASELAGALKLPDSATVQFPSGRRATVGQIKFVMPEVEKRLGHRVAASRPPSRSGPAIEVTAKSDWKSILRKPDGTVLEAPDGQRITVGEVKDALKTSGRNRAPDKAAPACCTTVPRKAR